MPEPIRDRWHYSGDVNCEYGGVWIDLTEWDNGYCDAVRVTDLDGGCGFRGACLIEHVTINGTDNARRIREALRSCGCLDWCARDQEAIRRRALRELCHLRPSVPDCILADCLSDMGGEYEADALWVRSYAQRTEEHRRSIRLMIAEALLSYGHYDPAQPDHYFDDRKLVEIVQMEADGPMQFDGWRADKRLHNTDLRAYVESVHLD